MLNPKANKERRIFFPWEGRGAWRRVFARGRLFTVLSIFLVFGLIFAMVKKERHAAGVRRTILTLSVVRPMVERYLLDKEGECPTDLRQVLSEEGKEGVPRDAWGHPLRLVCPSHRPGSQYVLMSDGPDGLPGGVDRIED